MQTAHATQNYSSLNDGFVMRVPVQDIVEFSAGGNVRHSRNENKYRELVEDVKQNGVTNSIVVRPSPLDESKVEVLAGYGRLSASRDLGLIDVTRRHQTG